MSTIVYIRIFREVHGPEALDARASHTDVLREINPAIRQVPDAPRVGYVGGIIAQGDATKGQVQDQYSQSNTTRKHASNTVSKILIWHNIYKVIYIK